MRWGTYRSVMWFTIGIKETTYFVFKNRTSKPLKLQKLQKNEDFSPFSCTFYRKPLYQSMYTIMVPPARIELAIDPYHGSVIPLN